MKKINFILLSFLGCFFFYNSTAQDSLNLEHIQQFSYPFTLENGVFDGPGAEILIKAVDSAHITMLGDDTRSKLEPISKP